MTEKQAGFRNRRRLLLAILCLMLLACAYLCTLPRIDQLLVGQWSFDQASGPVVCTFNPDGTGQTDQFPGPPIKWTWSADGRTLRTAMEGRKPFDFFIESFRSRFPWLTRLYSGRISSVGAYRFEEFDNQPAVRIVQQTGEEQVFKRHFADSTEAR